MERLCQTTGWGCAWGSVAGALFGGSIDFLFGPSGLLALVFATAGALLGSFFGFKSGLKAVENEFLRANCPLEVISIHKQHGAICSLMGAKVGGMAGSAVGAGVAAVGWVWYLNDVPTMMEFMSMVKVVIGGGIGGMVGGVGGAWWSVVHAGFVGENRRVPSD
ncbi:hypothetical protein BSNK01_12690 [Bacillaceae bacterium]